MKKLLLLLLICLAQGFSPLAAQASFQGDQESDLIQELRRGYYSQEFGFEVPEDFNSMLYDTISTWLGTPYRFAGNCEKGIDCSGFVTLMYNRVFGFNLGARSSGEIYQLVEKIDKDELQEGDLVFFSIRRRRISHIGLYLGQNKFVHSSTSRGVIISDLNEAYYKRSFAGAGRPHNTSPVSSADSNQ